MNKFDEPQPLNQAAEFHTTFQHPILEQAQIPAKERAELRVSLLSEELKELQTAIESGNLVEVADALCDLQYVLSGAVHEFGLSPKFKALFDEVHRSNMSKACTSAGEAQVTMQDYFEKDGTEAEYMEIDGKFLVYRKSDKKTLKSINYSPADIKGILGAE